MLNARSVKKSFQAITVERLGEHAVTAAAAEVRAALLEQPPSLPSKLFYDDEGSRLFEAITALPEYYQTRTEQALLEHVAPSIVDEVQPAELVELGSGGSPKMDLLLRAMQARGTLRSIVMLDVNESMMRSSAARLHARFPAATVRCVEGDFQRDLGRLGPGGRRLIAFLGGTIGNLHPEHEVPRFLAAIASVFGPGDGFLLGVDLVKDAARLHAAYNDSAGVTAAFNLNILRAVNAVTGGRLDPADFEHVAFWDPASAWIEMRLRALRAGAATLPDAGVAVRYEAGDEVRTEISCKYTRETLEARLPGTGLRLDGWFEDGERLFGLALLRRDA